MCLAGALAKRRGRFSVPVVGTLVSLAQQLDLYLFYLVRVVGPNLRDQRVVCVTKGVEPRIPGIQVRETEGIRRLSGVIFFQPNPLYLHGSKSD